MAIKKTFICLANSRMDGGSCVAGREWNNRTLGNWIRVADSYNSRLIGKQERYDNDEDGIPKILDVVEVELLVHQPKGNHTENWIIYPNTQMRLADCLGDGYLDALVDNKGVLWADTTQIHSNNDRIRQADAINFDHSLRFIKVQEITLAVSKKNYPPYNTQHRAIFSHLGLNYNLKVTDRDIEKKFPIGSFLLNDCHLTVSLGGYWNGFNFKLAAAVVYNNYEELT